MMMMPVMNGWEFLAAQKGDPTIAGVPVVVVAAIGSNQEDTANAAAVMKKPIEMQALLDTVKQYC